MFSTEHPGAVYTMRREDSFSSRRLAASLGFLAVGLFGSALTVFAILTPEFDSWEDYVSELGAIGQPYALWWNLIGFLAVGAVLAAFGLAYGRVIGDWPVGCLLAAFGIGFGSTAIPVDLADDSSVISTAHTVAICLGLAAWVGGLARMAHLSSLGRAVHLTANATAVMVVLPIVGLG